MKQSFKETEKLIKNQTEINGVTTIDCKEYTWSSTSLLCDRAYQITDAVFADSMLCLGSMREWCLDENHLKDRQADGVRVENIPRIHKVELPRTDSRIYERTTV